MAILNTDIIFRLSGGSSNTDPLLSLGGVKSSTAASTNGFDDVTSGEAAAGDVEYRCEYIHNAHATLTMLATKIFIQTNTPSSSTTVAIGLGTSGLNAIEQTVANENTAPTGVTFSSPADLASGLTIGDIPPGQHFPVWIRRTVTAGAASVVDNFTLRVQCDTNP